MRYGVLAHALFLTMDLLYGRARHLSKFKVLEVIARVPYQAWEHVAYIVITHMHPGRTSRGASSSGSRKVGSSRTTNSGTS